MCEYIYLLQEREFISTNQNVYKIGKTKQENLARFKQYPKGSKLIIQILCTNCDVLESELIQNFRTKYTHRKDIGNEYFEGNYIHMIDDMYQATAKSYQNADNTSNVSQNIEVGEPVFEPLDEEHLSVLLDAAIRSDGIHSYIAEIVHYIYKDELKLRNKIWYMYDKDAKCWSTLDNDAIPLHNIICGKIKRLFINRSHYHTCQGFQNDNPEQKDLFEERAKTSLKIALNCSKLKFRNLTITELKRYFFK
jgi:hypothetical protein